MENTPISPIQQPVPPVQQYAPQPIPPVHSHGPVIAAVVVGIVVLAGAAFAYTKLVNKPAETSSPTPSPSTSASATPDATAGWKTYTSAQLGYEFRYPTTWKLETATHTEAGGLKRTLQVAQVTPPGAQPIQAAFTVEQDYLTLSQVHAQPGTETIVEVSGKTGYQHVQANSPDIVIFVPSAGLHISLHTPSPEMLQILSTFKFTSISSAPLKSYTSQALNVSFKYPGDWVVTENNSYPGSAQGNDELRITKDSDVIYASAKRDCLVGAAYCKPVPAQGWPSFSTTSTNSGIWRIIDEIITTTTPSPTASWKTYTSALYSYQFKYPTGFSVVPTNTNGGDPACGDILLGVCAIMSQEYRTANYAGTNLAGAGFAVRILDTAGTNFTTEASCDSYAGYYESPKSSEHLTETTVIHGVTFYRATNPGTAGLGTITGGTFYRTFHGGKCWELYTGSSFTGTGPDYGGAKPLTPTQTQSFNALLNNFLNSFVFTK